MSNLIDQKLVVFRGHIFWGTVLCLTLRVGYWTKNLGLESVRHFVWGFENVRRILEFVRHYFFYLKGSKTLIKLLHGH